MANESLAPTIRIEVSGQELSADITKYVQKCVVEQSQEMADKVVEKSKKIEDAV